MSRLLIAASGTGGHIFPALSVLQALPGSWAITWLGVPNRLETELVPKDVELVTVPAGGIQGNPVRKILNLFQLLLATFFVICLIRKRKIEVVFTTGGYIAAPAVLAAKFSRKPVIFHEANAYPGRVTRLLGRYCNVVALGFSETSNYLSRSKTIFTGTPVRRAFLTSQSIPSWVPLGSGPLIVVMGGSQGAVALNHMVRPLFPYLLEEGFRVVHLTGMNDYVTARYEHENFVTIPFSDEIPGLLQHADLVISRAGAGALSEFAVTGLPAVLVPYPYASDKHQDFNAVCMAQKAAALIVHQGASQHISLERTLRRLLNKDIETSKYSFLYTMKEAMLSIAIRNADQKVVEILEQVIA